ncbi:MAG TPA: hypothetical protein VGH99_23140 [Pseudonocardia sp.]|jgi:hypothetical protein
MTQPGPFSQPYRPTEPVLDREFPPMPAGLIPAPRGPHRAQPPTPPSAKRSPQSSPQPSTRSSTGSPAQRSPRPSAQPSLPPPAPAPRNRCGGLALTLGVGGLVFGLLPLTGFVACLCGALGIVLGAVGLARVRRGTADNRWAARVGTGLSAVALALGIWGVVVTLQAVTTQSALLVSFGGHRPAPTPSPSAQRAVPGRIGDGSYLVGTDIQPGVYHSAGPVSPAVPYCYWARQRDDSGEMSSLITHDNVGGPATVTVRSTDEVFSTSGCQPWMRVG